MIYRAAQVMFWRRSRDVEMGFVAGSEASDSAFLWKPSVPSSCVVTTIQRGIKVGDGKWRVRCKADGEVDKASLVHNLGNWRVGNLTRRRVRNVPVQMRPPRENLRLGSVGHQAC
jgi:hypothetical protein